MKTVNFERLRRWFSALLVLALLGCGKGGFSILGSGDSANQGSSVGSGDFGSLDYKAAVSGGPNDGVTAVSLDKTHAALILVLPLQVNSYVGTTSGVIPALAGAKFETYRDAQGKSYFALSLPLQFVAKGAAFLPKARFPNGNPLPQVANGALPSLNFSLPGKDMVQVTVYIDVNAVGILLMSPYDPFLPLRFPIRSGITDVGFYDSVPAVGEFKGGFYLTTTLPPDVATLIDEHFRF